MINFDQKSNSFVQQLDAKWIWTCNGSGLFMIMPQVNEFYVTQLKISFKWLNPSFVPVE